MWLWGWFCPEAESFTNGLLCSPFNNNNELVNKHIAIKQILVLSMFPIYWNLCDQIFIGFYGSKSWRGIKFLMLYNWLRQRCQSLYLITPAWGTVSINNYSHCWFYPIVCGFVRLLCLKKCLVSFKMRCRKNAWMKNNRGSVQSL